VLNSLIDEVDRKIGETNAASAQGRIKQSLINILIYLDDAKKGIPE
jgi:hypothetical protein